MLILDSRCAIIDGVSVFPDHAEPLQWYYLPTSPHLTVRDGTPNFQLIGFRGGDDDGGGLLSFDVNVGLDDRQITSLRGKIRDQFDLEREPNIGPVPLVDGTVRLIGLGSESGRTPVEGEPVPEDPFVARIMHNVKPSLYNDNQASFSVLLKKGGFALVEGTLDAVILPIAVVYSLDYLALRPAYKVTLKIDWDRVQDHLDETFGAKAWIFSSEISEVVDKLDESKVIDLQVDTFVTEDTEGVIDRRDAALAQVKAMITTAFFEASIPPWTPEKPADWEKALKAVGEFASQSAALAAGGPAGAAASSASFSYKRTHYTRIDKKHLDVNFSERTTVRRSIYPQGHLESLFSVIAASPDLKDRLVRMVTVNPDFFKKRKVHVEYRPNLGLPLINAIDVRATYGGITHNTLINAPGWSTDFEWLSDVTDGVMAQDVMINYDVLFKDVDSSERPASLSTAPKPFAGDVLPILPEEDLFSIRSVPVRAENIPWTRFSSVQVEVRYTDEANGIDERQLFRLDQQKSDDMWSVFLMDDDKTGYQVRRVLRAVDGNDFDSGWEPSDDEEIRVTNPFKARTVSIRPDLSWNEIKEVFVDMRYEDPGNDLLVTETLQLTQGSPSAKFVVDLRDPTRRAVEYAVSFSYADGRLKQLPPSVTFADVLTVGPDKLGHRVIEVLPAADWEQKHVERMTLDFRFEDFEQNISKADTFELAEPGATARFEFDYADEDRNRFEWKQKVVFANGLVKSTEWTISAEPVLQLRLP